MRSMTIRFRRPHRLAALAVCTAACLALPAGLRAAPLDPNSFPGLGILNAYVGTLNINTDTLTMSGAASFTGVTFDQGPVNQNSVIDFNRTIAVFDFYGVILGPFVTVNVIGSRPLAILSRSAISISTNLNLSATDAAGGPAGGAAGGDANHLRSGPGGGGLGRATGGGGGFGGAGGAGRDFFPGDIGAGASYGDLFARLQAGSGGGGSMGYNGAPPSSGGGGGGGGAIELGAVSSISLATITASGAHGASETFNGNGGGSGGGILLHAPSLSFTSLQADGGAPGSFGDGNGGGGRVALSVSSLTPALLSTYLSSVSLDAGPAFVSPPGTAGQLSIRSESFTVPAGQNTSLASFTPASGTTTPAVSIATLSLSVPAGATATLAADNFVDPAIGTADVNGTLVLGPYAQTLRSLTGSGTVNLAGGTLTLGAGNVSSSFAGTLTGTGTLVKTGLGTLTLNSVPQSSLFISGKLALNPSGGPSQVSSLSISTGGVLDLANNPFTLAYTGPSPADAIRQYLRSSQLTSSSSDATHRLGYLDTPPFSGEPTAPTSLSVKLTLTGDANLDGVLNADDYALLDKGFATHGTFWQEGDFDYDGAVTSADYLLIDTTYAQAQGLTPAFLSTRESQFGPAYVSQLIAAVPEPTSLLAACGLALPLLTCRAKGGSGRGVKG